MRILMLSFYYPPDLSAGSFRAKSISEALASKLSSNDTLDIITTSPNRYATYSELAPEVEQHESISVRRIYVTMHKSGMVDQSIAFLKYARGVWKNIRHQKYDLVLATSSRLTTAFLGAIIARRINRPLYLDIRDIFTDTLNDVLAGRLMILLLPFFRIMERYTMRSAQCINLVSEGFREHFKNISPSARYSFYPNGIDEEFIEYDYLKTHGETRKVILYAGNIGEGQGLHRIIPEAAARLHEDYEFLIIGDGGMRRELENQVNRHRVSNVRIINPVGRQELREYYKNADYLLLHLNDYSAFKKVLPSKIFEYAATGKPIIAGVAGFSKVFINKNIDNAIIFNPCDVDALVAAIIDLPLKMTNRQEFISKFKRNTIMPEMAEDIMQCSFKY